MGIGSRVRAAAAGLVMVAVSGCLESPPDSSAPGADGGSSGGGDAGAPGDGSPDGCDPFLMDGFDDDLATRARFTVEEAPPDSTVDITGGLARVRAYGGAEMVGFAALRTLSAYELSSSALEVVFDTAEVSASGGVVVALDTSGQESWEVGALDGRVVSSHTDAGGTTEYLCDPCDGFAAGAWTVRLEESGNVLTLLAGPDRGSLTDLYPGGFPVVAQDVYAQIFVAASDVGDMASADLDSVSWSRCD